MDEIKHSDSFNTKSATTNKIRSQKLRTVLKRKGETKALAVLLAKQESIVLFDIAACHCLDLINCTCPRDSKVPALERDFLLDQRNEKRWLLVLWTKKLLVS